MVLKFIGFVALCAVFLVFIGLNLENKCDISFGFAKLSNVPVFFTVLVSFAAGLLVSVPVAVSIRLMEKRKRKKETLSPKRAGKTHGKDAAASRENAEVEEENGGAYGID